MQLVLKSMIEVYVMTGVLAIIIFLLAVILLRKGEIDVDIDTFEQKYLVDVLKNGHILIALAVIILMGMMWPRVAITILEDEK